MTSPDVPDTPSKDLLPRILPRLISLKWTGAAWAVVLTALVWAAATHRLPGALGNWAALRFMFSYALAIICVPVLIYDYLVLARTDAHARVADETPDWLQASADYVEKELPYQERISEVRKTVTSIRDYFASLLLSRWYTFYFVAVATAVASLIASIQDVGEQGDAGVLIQPLGVTGGISLAVILLAGFCHLKGNQLWATWERQVHQLQKDNPRFAIVDTGESRALDPDVIDIPDELETEVAAGRHVAGSGAGALDVRAQERSRDDGGWGATQHQPPTPVNGWGQPDPQPTPAPDWTPPQPSRPEPESWEQRSPPAPASSNWDSPATPSSPQQWDPPPQEDQPDAWDTGKPWGSGDDDYDV